MPTVLITGGTGLLGTALTTFLVNKGYKVTILTRDPTEHKPVRHVQYAGWDVKRQIIDPAAIGEADHIIHLAGAGVADKRWSKKRKQEIRDSRVNSGNLIVKALNETPNKVKSVVSASGIGWYGPDPVRPNPEPFKETDPPSADFLGETCRLWEDSLKPVTDLGKRMVHIRTGIVLAKEGGALPEFMRPLRFGVATILGDGNQVCSWIHIHDIIRLYTDAIENIEMNGAYNGVSPNPVTNKELTLSLAKYLRGKMFIPLHVPEFALKLALGEMSIEVLKSATVSSAKTRQAAFQFAYPTLDSALQQLIGPAL
jgi:uncharacterized protein (TIGR01777 family)